MASSIIGLFQRVGITITGSAADLERLNTYLLARARELVDSRAKDAKIKAMDEVSKLINEYILTRNPGALAMAAALIQEFGLESGALDRALEDARKVESAGYNIDAGILRGMMGYDHFITSFSEGWYKELEEAEELKKRAQAILDLVGQDATKAKEDFKNIHESFLKTRDVSINDSVEKMGVLNDKIEGAKNLRKEAEAKGSHPNVIKHIDHQIQVMENMREQVLDKAWVNYSIHRMGKAYDASKGANDQEKMNDLKRDNEESIKAFEKEGKQALADGLSTYSKQGRGQPPESVYAALDHKMDQLKTAHVQKQAASQQSRPGDRNQNVARATQQASPQTEAPKTVLSNENQRGSISTPKETGKQGGQSLHEKVSQLKKTGKETGFNNSFSFTTEPAVKTPTGQIGQQAERKLPEPVSAQEAAAKKSEPLVKQLDEVDRESAKRAGQGVKSHVPSQQTETVKTSEHIKSADVDGKKNPQSNNAELKPAPKHSDLGEKPADLDDDELAELKQAKKKITDSTQHTGSGNKDKANEVSTHADNVPSQQTETVKTPEHIKSADVDTKKNPQSNNVEPKPAPKHSDLGEKPLDLDDDELAELKQAKKKITENKDKTNEGVSHAGKIKREKDHNKDNNPDGKGSGGKGRG